MVVQGNPLAGMLGGMDPAMMQQMMQAMGGMGGGGQAPGVRVKVECV